MITPLCELTLATLSMKLTYYSVLNVLLISLPLIWVTLTWNDLPAQLPMHFNSDRQPDRFGSQQEWLGMLLSLLFFSTLIRAVVLRIAGSQENIQPTQRRALELLTAGFIGCTLALHILQAFYKSPIYSDWIPVLFFLSGSTFNYVAVPRVLPIQEKDPAILNLRLANA